MASKEHRGKLRFTGLILAFASTTVYEPWFDWAAPVIPRTVEGLPDLNAPGPRMTEGRGDLSWVWNAVTARGSLFDARIVQDWALDAALKHEGIFTFTN